MSQKVNDQPVISFDEITTTYARNPYTNRVLDMRPLIEILKMRDVTTSELAEQILAVTKYISLNLPDEVDRFEISNMTLLLFDLREAFKAMEEMKPS